MEFKDLILEKSEELKDYLIESRRYLHENAELSGKEIITSEFLKEEIKKLGLEVYECKETGFYSVLDSGKEGKTLGIRTDIDALPVMENENNLKGQRICRSKNDGVMHACGHDGHMAILLASAKFLVENKDKLKGKIVFIFEEGEEQGTGIDAMLEALKNLDIDAFYGNHLTSFMKTGEISIDEGSVMAGCAVVWIDVLGKGGHGSRPDLSINPIFAASNILNNLTSAWANQIDVTKTVTLGIGSINAGSNLAPNVIPDKVEITGTLRFFDMEEGKKAMNIIKNICDNISISHNCKVSYHKKHRIAVNPVINDKKLSKLGKDTISKVLDNSIVSNKKWFASETFSRYQELAPSVFTFVGTQSEKIGSGAEHHNEYFDIDEKSLKYGFIATSTFAYNYLLGENNE